MITIKEVLQLPEMHEFQIVAGRSGLKNQIFNLGFLDYEELNDLENSFSKDDFVLTSLARWHNDFDLCEQYLNRLISIGVCGIAIKNVFISELSENILSFANKKNVPIFFYGVAVNSEDVAVAIKNAIRDVEKYSKYEKIISKIIERRCGLVEFENNLEIIKDGLIDPIGVIYLKLNHDGETSSGENLKFTQSMEYTSKVLLNQNSLRFYQYKNGIFILCEYRDSSFSNFKSLKHSLSLHEKSGDYYVGYDLSFSDDVKLQNSLVNAISASHVCELRNADFISYDNIGVYKQLLPIYEDSPLWKHSCNTIAVLTEYDKLYNSNLLQTAMAYVENNKEVGNTALTLEQHKNTVRYRLKKIQEILEWDNYLENDFYEQLFIDIKAYQIISLIKRNS